MAELQWYVLTTHIRCHAVEMVLTGREAKLLENLVLDVNRMTLPEDANPTNTGGGAFPVCVKDYARGENPITRVEPVFSEHKFNPVPLRIVIDKEGKVKHIHFLSAFPDQAKAITDALNQWKFKQYLRGGNLRRWKPDHVWAGSVSDGTHLRPCGDRMIFEDFCTPGDPPGYDLRPSSIALEGELLRLAYP